MQWASADKTNHQRGLQFDNLHQTIINISTTFYEENFDN